MLVENQPLTQAEEDIATKCSSTEVSERFVVEPNWLIESAFKNIILKQYKMPLPKYTLHFQTLF